MARDPFAPLLTWWLAIAFGSGAVLWIGFGNPWPAVVAVHVASAALTTVGSIGHAARSRDGRRARRTGAVALLALLPAVASGFMAHRPAWALAHGLWSLALLGVAMYVHIGRLGPWSARAGWVAGGTSALGAVVWMFF